MGRKGRGRGLAHHSGVASAIPLAKPEPQTPWGVSVAPQPRPPPHPPVGGQRGTPAPASVALPAKPEPHPCVWVVTPSPGPKPWPGRLAPPQQDTPGWQWVSPGGTESTQGQILACSCLPVPSCGWESWRELPLAGSNPSRQSWAGSQERHLGPLWARGPLLLPGYVGRGLDEK